MRKFIVICISIVTTLTIVACGNNGNADNLENSITKIENTETNSNITNETANFNNALTKIYNIPTRNIYMNVPDYQRIESNRSQLFVIGRQINIAVTANWRIQGTTVEQAQEDIFRDYKENLHAWAPIDELKIEQDSKVTINGTEMYKFEGKLACHGEAGNYELYTIGYSFVMDGIPCSIEGTVLDKSQPQDMIDNVRDTINAMAQTVRNTK
jgi:hypothetical protein